jgi:hypothetical protein
MSQTQPRGTLLDLPLIEERYGWSFCIAVALHGILLTLLLVAPFLMPKMSILQMGTGPGGGRAGDSYTVGVTDEPGGGAGLFKPATPPKPPRPRPLRVRIRSPLRMPKEPELPAEVPVVPAPLPARAWACR